MTRSLIAALVLVAGLSGAAAEGPRFHAGVIRTTVGRDPSFDTLYWYPTVADEIPWQAGPFTMPATRDASVADGKFPMVLLSHGGGRTGGTPLLLREIAAGLARQGFVVVAPFHGKSGLQDRTMQMKSALEGVLADQRLGAHIDAAKIGMVDFSLGTAVALELGGALPNPQHMAAYCGGHPQDVMSCSNAPDGRTSLDPTQPAAGRSSQPSRLPLKAIALLDPYAVMFGPSDLKSVTMPILIFRPQQSELTDEPNVAALTISLPRPPEVKFVPGGHFVFADICPDSLNLDSGDICRDPPGVDRGAVHRAVHEDISKFFRQHL